MLRYNKQEQYLITFHVLLLYHSFRSQTILSNVWTTRARFIECISIKRWLVVHISKYVMLLFLFLVSRKEKERKYLSNLVQKFLKILESIPETGN